MYMTCGICGIWFCLDGRHRFCPFQHWESKDGQEINETVSRSTNGLCRCHPCHSGSWPSNWSYCIIYLTPPISSYQISYLSRETLKLLLNTLKDKCLGTEVFRSTEAQLSQYSFAATYCDIWRLTKHGIVGMEFAYKIYESKDSEKNIWFLFAWQSKRLGYFYI